MKKSITGSKEASRATYEALEGLVREKEQGFIQEILEEELTEFLARGKSERLKAVDGARGYRNGHGKPRKLGLMSGTITVRRPRVRDTDERFESKVLPLFKRRTKEVGEMLPELYLHGLAQGDFEMALRGLLGEGAPLSASSIERLKAKWQLEYEEWKGQDLPNPETASRLKFQNQAISGVSESEDHLINSFLVYDLPGPLWSRLEGLEQHGGMTGILHVHVVRVNGEVKEGFELGVLQPTGSPAQALGLALKKLTNLFRSYGLDLSVAELSQNLSIILR